MKWPKNTAHTEQLFYNIAGFPNEIGAIVCTHFALKHVADDVDVNKKTIGSENYYHTINTVNSRLLVDVSFLPDITPRSSLNALINCS